MFRRKDDKGKFVKAEKKPSRQGIEKRVAHKDVDDSGRDLDDKRGDLKMNAVEEIEDVEEVIEKQEGTAKEFESILLDTIEIKQGDSTIKISLTKTKNRMVRFQIFLNGFEIRPTTFTGMVPAQNYWKLLKSTINNG